MEQRRILSSLRLAGIPLISHANRIVGGSNRWYRKTGIFTSVAEDVALDVVAIDLCNEVIYLREVPERAIAMRTLTTDS